MIDIDQFKIFDQPGQSATCDNLKSDWECFRLPSTAVPVYLCVSWSYQALESSGFLDLITLLAISCTIPQLTLTPLRD